MHKRMGQSARADCVVGAKYHLQCAVPDRDWKCVCSPCKRTYQITIPITFWITFRNVFQNVILVHVNTPIVSILKCPCMLPLFWLVRNMLFCMLVLLAFLLQVYMYVYFSHMDYYFHVHYRHTEITFHTYHTMATNSLNESQTGICKYLIKFSPDSLSTEQRAKRIINKFYIQQVLQCNPRRRQKVKPLRNLGIYSNSEKMTRTKETPRGK